MYPGPKLCHEVWSRKSSAVFPVRNSVLCALPWLSRAHSVTVASVWISFLLLLRSHPPQRWGANSPFHVVFLRFSHFLHFAGSDSTARRVRSSAWRQVFSRTAYSNECVQMSFVVCNCSLHLLQLEPMPCSPPCVQYCHLIKGIPTGRQG